MAEPENIVDQWKREAEEGLARQAERLRLRRIDQNIRNLHVSGDTLSVRKMMKQARPFLRLWAIVNVARAIWYHMEDDQARLATALLWAILVVASIGLADSDDEQEYDEYMKKRVKTERFP